MEEKQPATHSPPPLPPWKDLCPNPQAYSYLAFYYSSLLSALPVRDVNRVVQFGAGGMYVADCKADPNWETGTFGLFSVCQADVRRGIVKNHAPYLFFFGNRVIDGKKRGVTGYYRLRWYTHGGTYAGDYCLAADKVHFVERPIPFGEINSELGTRLSNRVPRLAMKLRPPEAEGLVSLLEHQPDVTARYIEDIHRLEHINARNSAGLKYVNFGRRESFSWRSLLDIKSLGLQSTAPRIRHTSANESWRCKVCTADFVSHAFLKICPVCGEHGVIEPNPQSNN